MKTIYITIIVALIGVALGFIMDRFNSTFIAPGAYGAFVAITATVSGQIFGRSKQ